MTCNTPVCAALCEPGYCAEKDAIGSYHAALDALRSALAGVTEGRVARDGAHAPERPHSEGSLSRIGSAKEPEAL